MNTQNLPAKIWASIIVFLLISSSFLASVQGKTNIIAKTTSTHFLVPTSNFRPMEIYVIDAKLSSADLVAGDEIAVFDGPTCAGVTVIDHVASSGNPVSVIAFQAFGDDTGFYVGNTIVYKCWIAAQGLEYTFSSDQVQYYDPVTGNPSEPKKFEGLSTAMVSLNGSFSPACTLTMQVNHAGWGTTTPAEGTYTYPSGYVVNITAHPTIGYEFINWTGGVSDPNDASTTVTLNTNKTVTANFQITGSGIIGDVNDDMLANSTDALIILSCDVGLNTTQFCPMNCGDVNADGLVNSTDALIILSYDVGLSVPFPVGQSGCYSSVTPCPGCNP